MKSAGVENLFLPPELVLRGIVSVRGPLLYRILEYCKSQCDNCIPINSLLAAYLDDQRCGANVPPSLRRSHAVHLPPCSWKWRSSHRRLWLRVTWAKTAVISKLAAAGQEWLGFVCLGRTALVQGICNPCKPGSNAVISQLEMEWHTQHLGEDCPFPLRESGTSRSKEE